MTVAAQRSTIRAALVGQLATLYATAGVGGVEVPVGLCHPGDQRKGEDVWLGPADGAQNAPVMDHAVRDDRFEQPVWIRCGNAGQTPEVAEARAAVLGTILEAWAALDRTLGGLVFDAVLGTVTGPNTDRETSGAISEIRYVLNVWAEE